MYKPYETMPTDNKKEAFNPDLQGFINWLKTKDPEEMYRWSSVFSCAVAQFNEAMGCSPVEDHTRIFGGSRISYHYVASGSTASIKNKADWTFGKALKRAEEVLRYEQAR